MEENKKKSRLPGQLAALAGVTVLCAAVTGAAAVGSIRNGPSASAAAVYEEQGLSAVLSGQSSATRTETAEERITVDTSYLSYAAPAEEETASESDDGIEIIQISRETIKGELMIVSDPSRIKFGISGEFGSGHAGKQLTELCEDYGAIAGINAGGYNDGGGHGNGGTPQGLVIYEGEILHGDAGTTYSVVGFTADHILRVGTMTGQAALDSGITDAVSFVTFNGVPSPLIIDGELVKRSSAGGINPRTAIGQREDGAVLLLVLDGRCLDSLGATVDEVAEIMQEYGAVNAANLDGGASSVMVYDGEYISEVSSVTGARRIPTAFLVLGGADE